MLIQEICQQLLILAASLIGVEAPEHCPPVSMLETSSLSQRVCGHPGCLVRGVFEREQEQIFLDQDLDFDFAFDRGIFLHELVHYLQHKNGRWLEGCSHALRREQEALDAQQAYLLSKGYRVPISRNLQYYRCSDADEQDSQPPKNR